MWSPEETVRAGSISWEVSGKENTLLGLFCFLWDLYWGAISFPKVESHGPGRGS